MSCRWNRGRRKKPRRIFSFTEKIHLFRAWFSFLCLSLFCSFTFYFFLTFLIGPCECASVNIISWSLPICHSRWDWWDWIIHLHGARRRSTDTESQRPKKPTALTHSYTRINNSTISSSVTACIAALVCVHIYEREIAPSLSHAQYVYTYALTTTTSSNTELYR